MKRAALLCLLLAACDRAEKSTAGGRADAPAGRSATRARSAEEELTSRRSGQIAAAAADPEVRRLLPGAMAEIAAGWDVLDPDSPGQGSALLNYYVARFPEAGLEWVLSLDGEKSSLVREAFADLLYTRDAELAYQLFARNPAGGVKLNYLAGLVNAAYSAGDIDRLWERVGANSPACDPDILLCVVRGGGWKSDPMDLWARVAARPGNEVTPAQFLEMVSPTARLYPGELLDQVPADQQPGLIQSAIKRSGSARNLASINACLAARPSFKEYDESNSDLALRLGQIGKDQEAVRAAELIIDGTLRQSVLDRLAKPVVPAR